MVPTIMREELRCVSTGAGEPSAMTAGIAAMPPWCADNWATTSQVSVAACQQPGPNITKSSPSKFSCWWSYTFLSLLTNLLTGGRPFGIRANFLFGRGSGFIALDEVTCNGTESELLSCRAQERGSHDCSHDEDAGALCPCENKHGLLLSIIA